MPNPTHSDLHVSRPLTDLSIAWFGANAGKYAARTVFPAVGVMKQADKYYLYDDGDLLAARAQRRAPGAEAMVGGYRVSTDSYLCDRWALAKDISDPERSNADPNFNLDQEATEYVTDQVVKTADKEWVDGFFTTATWTGASNSSDMTGQSAPSSTTNNFRQWNDVASTPIEDIRGEMLAVESKTGYKPNMLTLGPQTYRHLSDHPDILDRIKNTTPGSPATVNRQLLAQLFELDAVNVLGAVVNTGPEGGADSIAYMAGKHALLTYTNPNPGLRSVTAGITFVWTANGQPKDGARIKRYRLERNESDRIEGEMWLDFKRVAAGLGAFFASAVA